MDLKNIALICGLMLAVVVVLLLVDWLGAKVRADQERTRRMKLENDKLEAEVLALRDRLGVRTDQPVVATET